LRDPAEVSVGGRYADQRPAGVRAIEDCRHRTGAGLRRPRSQGSGRTDPGGRMNAAAPAQRNALPAAFLAGVEQLIPAERLFDDPLSTLAFGTDASFYRLIPKLVVRVESENEVIRLLKLAHAEKVPVTFRAAGT